jgi:hypothetical protein
VLGQCIVLGLHCPLIETREAGQLEGKQHKEQKHECRSTNIDHRQILQSVRGFAQLRGPLMSKCSLCMMPTR